MVAETLIGSVLVCVCRPAREGVGVRGFGWCCRRVSRVSPGGGVVSTRPWSAGVCSRGKNTRGSRLLQVRGHVASLVSQDVDGREEVASRGWASGCGLWVAADEGVAGKEAARSCVAMTACESGKADKAREGPLGSRGSTRVEGQQAVEVRHAVVVLVGNGRAWPYNA